MQIQEIRLEDIHLENELFRISEALDVRAIADSIAAVGQLNPIILHEWNSRLVVVCGFRRIHAIRSLRIGSALARVLPASHDLSRVYMTALWDNLSHRQLDLLEKARVLFGLRTNFGVSDENLLKVYLPMLGLNPHSTVLRSFILIHQIRPALRTCLLEGRLTQTSIEMVSEMPPSVQDTIASLMDRIRLSASLQKKFLSLLQDIAGLFKSEISEPFGRPEMQAIIGDPRLTPFQRGEKAYEFLYRLRNPRLSQAQERFVAQKELLRLPGPIRITAPPFFEEPGLHTEFDARNVEQFRELVSALRKAAENSELENLFIVK